MSLFFCLCSRNFQVFNQHLVSLWHHDPGLVLVQKTPPDLVKVSNEVITESLAHGSTTGLSALTLLWKVRFLFLSPAGHGLISVPTHMMSAAWWRGPLNISHNACSSQGVMVVSMVSPWCLHGCLHGVSMVSPCIFNCSCFNAVQVAFDCLQY